jgi:hypothetical protein
MIIPGNILFTSSNILRHCTTPIICSSTVLYHPPGPPLILHIVFLDTSNLIEYGQFSRFLITLPIFAPI